jgi:hydroxymethylpyrimidine kinase/phosphomethylpyrimidine kinase
MRTVLTIAGSDPSGGAGIQADARTMTVIGVFAMSALAALTAQNTRGVTGIHPVPPEFLALQIETVLSDIRADAVKTGMLATAGHVSVVRRMVDRFRVPNLVVDPVMVSKSGHSLLDPRAVESLVAQLIPVAMVVTPNIPEAEILVGRTITTVEEMEEAARLIGRMGPRAVVVKGGHRAGNAVDVLWLDGVTTRLSGERIEAGPVHGTGCTFSAAIASYLALGQGIPEAVAHAKEFITRAIIAAEPLGGGHPPANQLWGHS